MRYHRKKAEARFGHLYSTISGKTCHYCGLLSDGFDHRPAIHTLHKFARDRLVTRKEIEEEFGPCRLVPCCTICNMGIGSYEGEDDDDRRQEILNFIDFYEDDGPRKNEWSMTAYYVAFEILAARTGGILGDEIYALPSVGRLIMSHALRVRMGTSQDNKFFEPHRERFVSWLHAEPRRRAKHFLAMAGLESYSFKEGVYNRS